MTAQEIINSLHGAYVGASLYLFEDINDIGVISQYGVMQSLLTDEGLKLAGGNVEVTIPWDEIDDLYEHINEYDQFMYVVEGKNFYLNLLRT